MSIKSLIPLLKQTYTEWNDHQATRFGASVAFYSLLSFAPLLVIVAAVMALVLNANQAQSSLIDQARQLIGQRGADTVKSLLASAQKPASGVFSELQDALNAMWDVKAPANAGWMRMIKDRLLSFGMVLSIGFLLLVSLLLSAGLAFIGKFFGQIFPVPPFVLEAVNFVVSFVVVTALFGMMFKFVPRVHISWRDVTVGAIGTALLFTIGKFLLGFYLGKASVGSAYGAAGSLVAVIVWVYYSAQIFFFGAEFTHVYADAHGANDKARRKPTPIGEPRSKSLGASAGRFRQTQSHSKNITS
jgi:membrane protein